MSDRTGQYVEAEMLVGFIRDVVNQRKIVENQPINWELLYKTADYHNVANLLYYAVLRMHQDIPREWSSRFSQKYRNAVVFENQYKKVVDAVLWNCRRQGIHVMVLEDYIYWDYYPMPEMRPAMGVEFLVDRGRRQEIDRMMHSMDFIPQVGEYGYSRSGLQIGFWEKLPFTDKRTAKYFGKSVRAMPREKGENYVHIFREPTSFIFLMCCKAQRFAEEEFDIRDMLDIWLCYRSRERGSDWVAIMKRLKKLGLWDFANRMLTLAEKWFGSGWIESEQELYDDLAAFIFSKGADGRNTAMKVLPLFKRVVKYRQKQEKQKRRKMFEDWLFPDQEYMQMLYPRMGKHRLLLPLCWLRRLCRTLVQRIRQKFGRNLQKE